MSSEVPLVRSMDGQRPGAIESPSPYETAKVFIRDRKVWSGAGWIAPRASEAEDRWLAVKLSLREWGKLGRELGIDSESDNLYPRFSYNAATSMLIIEYMASPLHESISSLIVEEFVTLKKNSPTGDAKAIRVVLAEDRNGFDGKYWGSGKRPDLAFTRTNANRAKEVKWVLETGFSETYGELVDDARLWLEGYPEVSMVVLVKFEEIPGYRCPLGFDDDLEQYGVALDHQAIRQEDVQLPQAGVGPATWKGLTWVGCITEVFMEMWVRDANGKATRQGNRANLLQDAQMHIPLGEVLGFPAGHDTLTVDLDEFRDLLYEEIRGLAVYRWRAFVIESKKRMGDRGDDRDYEP